MSFIVLLYCAYSLSNTLFTQQFSWCVSSQTGFQLQQRYVLGAMIFIIYGMSAVYRSGFPLIFTQMVYIPNAGSNNGSSDSNGELICPIRHSTAKNEATSSVRINIITAQKLGITCLIFLFI